MKAYIYHFARSLPLPFFTFLLMMYTPYVLVKRLCSFWAVSRVYILEETRDKEETTINDGLILKERHWYISL